MTTLLPKAIGAVAIAMMFSTLSMTPGLALTSETNEAWCSVDQGATNCLYRSLEECVYVVRPGGGTCIPNPAISEWAMEEFDD